MAHYVYLQSTEALFFCGTFIVKNIFALTEKQILNQLLSPYSHVVNIGLL